MTDARSRWIDSLLGEMTLEQKIGQVMVFGFAGPVITPDIVELIQKHHLGGLRISLKFRTQTLLHDQKPGTEPNENVLRSIISPSGKNRDYADPRQSPACTAKEYADVLNKVRSYALDRKSGIPLHFTIDQEGNGSDDMLCGQKLFPNPMGFTAAGDPELAYRVAVSIGKQARALGANMIHSPVLDVNTNPQNPEIGTRSYSDRPQEVIEYAKHTLRGFRETGLIATGKHFPGRGESISDAHWGLPVVQLNKEIMEAIHIMPFRELIKAGLPAIMTAHSIYPVLDKSDLPASCNPAIVMDYLRSELGFKGVITTDNMMMGGIIQKFNIIEAIIRAIEAGNDLILYRDESPMRIKILQTLGEAVRSGRISETRINESVERILGLRWEMGLAENGGMVESSTAEASINDPFVVKTSVEAAEKSVLLMRDEENLLPLRRDQKILLIEQIFSTHQMANNMYCHPGMLWEELCEESSNVYSVEVPMVPTVQDRERILRRLDEADVVVTTNYYYHKAVVTMTELIREVQTKGIPIVVISNNPYERAAPADFPTVICLFTAGGRENLRAAVRVLYGKLKPMATLHVRLN